MHHLSIQIARDARSEYELEFNVMILSVFASHSLRFIFRTDARKQQQQESLGDRVSGHGRDGGTHEAHALSFMLACLRT